MTTAPAQRRVRLFRNGRSQAVRIPREFELPGEEAVIRREGDRLVLELPDDKPRTLGELFDKWIEEGDIDEPWPEIERGPPRDVKI